MTILARWLAPVALVLTIGSGLSLAAELAESKRLGQAKDYIAEEQWTRAIEVLRQAIADAKEPGRDEALYWLAHSLNEYGDTVSALQAIRRLETEYRSSMWLKPAGALRILMAVRMGRNDVLWFTVAPPSPPAVHGTPAVPPPAPARPPRATVPPPPADGTAPAAPTPPVPPASPARMWAPAPMPPPKLWLPESYVVDTDLRIQALSSLIRSEADKVIPILLQIALESDNASEASRAVFVMAQSAQPVARESVTQVARSAAEPARVAAIRELGRFEGPEISGELIQVYSTGQYAVKRQVVKSLGERRERVALLRIAQSETNPELRSRAILTLGQIGGTVQLKQLYGRVGQDAKRTIVLGLFNAKADVDLIQLAERERDRGLRREIFIQLRMLGTPRAKEYLVKVSADQ
jgi:hypothetical protein